MKAIIQSLYDLGFAEDHVHLEFFGPAVSLDFVHAEKRKSFSIKEKTITQLR